MRECPLAQSLSKGAVRDSSLDIRLQFVLQCITFIEATITKDVTLSLRIDRKLANKLERHAKQAKRSKSSFAAIAIESYLEVQSQELALIKQTRDAIRAGEPTVANEDVVRWIKSWGTPDELPMPKPVKRA